MENEMTIRDLLNAKGFEDRPRPSGARPGQQGREVVHVGTDISLGIWEADAAVEDIIHGTQAVAS